MKKLTLFLGFLVLSFGIIVIFGKTTLAYQGDLTIKGPYYSPERHDAMIKAFENKDYNSWRNLMRGKGMVSQLINENNFSKFAEAHLLIQQGKLTEAKTILQELGLGSRIGGGSRIYGARILNR